MGTENAWKLSWEQDKQDQEQQDILYSEQDEDEKAFEEVEHEWKWQQNQDQQVQEDKRKIGCFLKYGLMLVLVIALVFAIDYFMLAGRI